MAKRKIYADKEKLIESELKERKDILSKVLDKLPNEELPFMENHLRALYFETYFLLAYGFYNASLVLMGILLENIVKEKLFVEGLKDEELEKMNFGQAISKCKKFLNKKEFDFLENRKEKIRNPYAHYNKMKLSKGIYFAGWKIRERDIVSRLIELDKRVRKGELTEAQARQELVKNAEKCMISSKELRPISQIAKSGEEEKQAVPIFLEIDKFIREFAEKYFKPSKKKVR